LPPAPGVMPLGTVDCGVARVVVGPTSVVVVVVVEVEQSFGLAVELSHPCTGAAVTSVGTLTLLKAAISTTTKNICNKIRTRIFRRGTLRG
jgi:hypothetical protein